MFRLAACARHHRQDAMPLVCRCVVLTRVDAAAEMAMRSSVRRGKFQPETGGVGADMASVFIRTEHFFIRAEHFLNTRRTFCYMLHR